MTYFIGEKRNNYIFKWYLVFMHSKLIYFLKNFPCNKVSCWIYGLRLTEIRMYLNHIVQDIEKTNIFL